MKQPQPTMPSKPKTKVDIKFLIERIIFSALWFVNGFLLLRILFHLLGANTSAPFIQWLYNISGYFVYPFQGILPAPQIGVVAVDTASIVAILIYFVAAIAIVRLINIGKGTIKRR